MKTRFQYFKQYIILSIVLNIPFIVILYIPLSHINLDLSILIGSTALVYGFSCVNSLSTWYDNYRFEYLEKQIKELTK